MAIAEKNKGDSGAMAEDRSLNVILLNMLADPLSLELLKL